MRHGNKVNKLGRTASHRRALMANLTISLIKRKRITTTLAKAKALRVYAEPILTKAKNDSTHSRRIVFSYLRDKESIQELFGPIAEKIASRPGGYTRILKLGNRMGDNSEMAMIELVDFNEYTDKVGKKQETKTKTRRGRAKAKPRDEAPAATETSTDATESNPE
ncbi:MAG: 50S ribosomal protein L17 [Bacteroidia bacterium]|nr:50S ribosomal protein L17 [Bacteroidia bacterium]